MVDGVGVCTICARVCHAGHDVTYSKHGSFFCDCGAKEDGSCIALVKRTSSAMVKYWDEFLKIAICVKMALRNTDYIRGG